ncbi:MAG: hypothetical protein C5B58_05350 [Acidobacteria bacterium]|nr:MAG: hypothetical protein C5B58_05350 [Acidobacteriota bacterium]
MLSDARRRLLQLVAFVTALPMAAVALWFVVGEYQDWRYVRPWQQVARGDPEDRVVALLGRPHRIILDRKDKAPWESERKIEWYDAQCIKQFAMLHSRLQAKSTVSALIHPVMRCPRFTSHHRERFNEGPMHPNRTRVS